MLQDVEVPRGCRLHTIHWLLELPTHSALGARDGGSLLGQDDCSAPSPQLRSASDRPIITEPRKLGHFCLLSETGLRKVGDCCRGTVSSLRERTLDISESCLGSLSGSVLPHAGTVPTAQTEWRKGSMQREERTSFLSDTQSQVWKRRDIHGSW